MSVTIKSSKMNYKDSQGNYVGVDVVAERSTEEIVDVVRTEGTSQMSNISTAGSTAVTNIQNKADEVTSQLASSGEMEDMIADTFEGNKNYAEGKYIIHTDNQQVNKLYNYTKDHTAGSWDGTEVREAKLADDVSDLKSALKGNVGIDLYKNSEISVDTYGDTYLSSSVSENVLSVTSTGSGFRWAKLKTSKCGFIRNLNFNYIILSEAYIDNTFCSLGVCIESGANYGKVFAFAYGSMWFGYDSAVISSGHVDNYDRYDCEYLGNGKYNISVNGTSNEIDLSNVVIGTIRFGTPIIGILIAPNATTSVNVIDRDYLLTKDEFNRDVSPSITGLSFIERGTETTLVSDRISVVTTEENPDPQNPHIYWSCVNSLDFSFCNTYLENVTDSTQTQVQWVVLSEATYNNIRYCIAIYIGAGSGFGKLYAFKNGTFLFTYTSESVLSGLSWFACENYRFEYIGDGVYNVYVRNVKSTIDLKNYSLNLGALDVRVRFSRPAIGIVLGTNSTDGVQIRIYDHWKRSMWYAFGDSLTESQGFYVPVACEITGSTAKRFGKGGETYPRLLSQGYVDAMLQSDEPEIITLFAGTNDFGKSTPVNDTKTALTTIVEEIYGTFPRVQIIIITPLQRNFDTSQDPDDTAGLGPNGIGKYLIDYVEVIKEVAQQYSIPCLDLYSCGGINALNVSQKTKDGLHPTPEYHYNIGVIIGNFINNYAPFKNLETTGT